MKLLFKLKTFESKNFRLLRENKKAQINKRRFYDFRRASSDFKAKI